MGWIKTSERLPEYGVEVLLHDGLDFYIGQRKLHLVQPKDYWDVAGDEMSYLYDLGLYPYWMPLPESPKEDEE